MKKNSILILIILVQIIISVNIFAQNNKHIVINLTQQKLYLYNGTKLVKSYPISSAKNGIGNKINSGKTPLGKHRIAGLFGKNQPKGMIFKYCKPIGKIAKINLKPVKKTTDLLTTRVIQLEGTETGKNLGGNVDSFKRGIMIHGTPDEFAIGTPASHGCIRLKNDDVIDLFKHCYKKMKVNLVK